MDPATTAAYNEFIKSGIIGAFLVLTLAGSATGAIRWGISVKELIASKDDALSRERADKIEAITGWKAQTDATNKVAAALEQTNAILLEREHRRRGGAA